MGKSHRGDDEAGDTRDIDIEQLPDTQEHEDIVTVRAVLDIFVIRRSSEAPAEYVKRVLAGVYSGTTINSIVSIAMDVEFDGYKVR
jgi:hypothetical protein